VAPAFRKEVARDVVNGYRPARPEGMPVWHYALAQQCWTANAEERPGFIDLLEEMHAKHEYVLEGADLGKVLEYEERVYRRYEGRGRIEAAPFTMEDRNNFLRELDDFIDSPLA
jgi:hypothetical protein